jgi:hypothetical protein
MFGSFDPSQFTITFTREGEIDVAPPADFDEADLPLMDHILSAVRNALYTYTKTPA